MLINLGEASRRGPWGNSFMILLVKGGILLNITKVIAMDSFSKGDVSLNITKLSAMDVIFRSFGMNNVMALWLSG